MSASRRRLVWIVLGILTAVQVGIGVWRVGVMGQEALAAGAQPIGWSQALGAELLMNALLALCAWWWLPQIGTGNRSPAAWAARFVILAWTVVLVHYFRALASGTGDLDPRLTWVTIAICFVLGAWIRRGGSRPDQQIPAPVAASVAWTHPAIWIGLWFYAAQAYHLVFPYQWTDARTMWACRAFKFVSRGGLNGVRDCLDPARPPLHSILLWLGIDDPTFQGRLLPFLMIGAFGLLVYHVLRRVAPRLAPWGVLWFFATDTLFRDAVTSYAGAPEMMAIGVAIILATDDGALAQSGSALAWGVIAGMAIALIKRDGLPEFVAAFGLLMVVSRGGERWDPRLWAPLAGAGIGTLSWTLRPHLLRVAAVFAPSLSGAAATESPFTSMGRLLFGVQGQVFSHYGWGAFAWTWLIVSVWAAYRGSQSGTAATELARRYGWFGLAGWVSTLGMYAALTFLGQPQMSTLFVIRTGFGRHLLHFFPFCLFHATAMAEQLSVGVGGVSPPSGRQ